MKFTRGRLKHKVDENFFDVWSRQMAYILGFTFADGNIYKTTLAWDVQKRDKDILDKISKAVSSTYPISLHRNASFRLRIHNQMFVQSAIKRGLLPKKNMRNILPVIPSEFLRHFVRGYLEGDGWIILRNGRNEADIGFASGSRSFLGLLNETITRFLGIKSGRVRKRIKVTPRGVTAITFMLEFYSSNAFKIAKWLYGNLEQDDIYLERKYKNYLRVKELYDFLNSGTKKIRIVQKEKRKPIKDILNELYVQNGRDGVQIAKLLGVHSSSIYRWLAQTGIKYPVKRIVT